MFWCKIPYHTHDISFKSTVTMPAVWYDQSPVGLISQRAWHSPRTVHGKLHATASSCEVSPPTGQTRWHGTASNTKYYPVWAAGLKRPAASGLLLTATLYTGHTAWWSHQHLLWCHWANFSVKVTVAALVKALKFKVKMSKSLPKLCLLQYYVEMWVFFLIAK